MKKSGGFTLIELLVVVGIIVLIASIVVTGSFGMSRASGYLAAENIVYNTLQAARQKACTDGKRVVVAFVKREEEYGDGDRFAIVMAEAVGTITEAVKGNYISDRCMTLGDYDSGSKGRDSIWNLRTGAYVPGPFTIGNSPASDDIPGGGGSFSYPTTTLTLSKGSFDKNLWSVGDPYGFQIGEMQELPTGFQFGFGSIGGSPEGKLIVFEPDGTSFHGTSSKSGIGNRSNNETSVFIYEEIAKDKAIEIKVKNGTIMVDRRA